MVARIGRRAPFFYERPHLKKQVDRAVALRIEPRRASLAPFGLPSLTPTARLPASGLRAGACVRAAPQDGRCLSSHLS